MHIELPYGTGTVPLDVPERNLFGVVQPNEYIPPQQPELMVKDALQNPFGTDVLSAMVRPGETVAVVIDDYTRPCPTQLLLPPILEELKTAGVNDLDIQIIIATGTHTPPSPEVVKKLVGDKIFRNYMVISNDAVNAQHVTIGKTKRGNTIEILKEYIDADVKILVGDIEYHYFAGYGGTRKSILPGISSKATIQRNHSLLFEHHACMGVLKENPIHQEMNEAMHLAGCDFALSVVQNSLHTIVGAWAGKPELVMDAGVKLVDTMYRKEISAQPDIVLTAANGHPHDINLYQAMKALHTACQIVKPNGVIVLVAKCPEGHGSPLYIDWLNRYKTSQQIQQALCDNFIIGAHKAYYHRLAVENHPVIFVSSMPASDVEGLFAFKKASTPNSALSEAFQIIGDDSRVLVVPQGTTTLLTLKK